MFRKIYLMTLFCTFTPLSFALTLSSNTKVMHFSQAKKHLHEIQKEHPYTLYCGCKYQSKTIDLKSCGYKVHKDPKRAARLEWEHVVPAQAFGHAFKEWREGDPKCIKRNRKFKGRKCAQTNALYSLMEADMYNLFPEIGELNALRSNFSMTAFGPLERKPSSKTFGECLAVISDRKFEPMDQAKGIVARVYLYMDMAYPGRGIISDKNKKLFEAWDKMFPVTSWECKRADLIKHVQGNENPILARACKA